MKKLLLSIMLLTLMATFTSCSKVGPNMGVFIDNNEKIADETFNKIICAIRLKDDSTIENMFSSAIKREETLSQQAVMFVGYIRGDIISFSSAAEGGVGVDSRIENGKKKKEIQSSFSLITTESTYYIAIKECIIDEFNEDNIGILSIYIIESNNWTTDYIYRGDGKWTPGINIVDSISATFSSGQV